MMQTSGEPGGELEALVRVRRLRTYFPIRSRTLDRRRRWCRAVDGVSLDIPQGISLGLVGESGCGKTTLGRTILRLVGATAGRILFDGVDVMAASGARLRNLRRDMQMIFQDPFGSLDPRMTVRRIIEEPLVIHRMLERRQRHELAAELLERVGMHSSHLDRYPHELSGGQRQRVSIARALAPRPRFIVCDEPVSALDVSIQAQILNLLGDLQHELGLTYLFIAHNLAVVKQFSDRVAVMYLGKIMEIADATDIYLRPRHPYTIALLAAAPEPDPTRRHRHMALSGDAPDPADVPRECVFHSLQQPARGCVFHSQCPFATDECRQAAPGLKPRPALGEHHLVACHYADESLAAP